MYDHIYCIPTHREILPVFLDGFLSEVFYVNKKLRKSCPLIIFEDTDAEINKEKIAELKKAYPQLIVHYITRRQVVLVYDMISELLPKSCHNIFRRLYPNSNVNYGNVFNRIFLFAVLFGAKNIHRRDSDVLPDKRDDGKPIYPIEPEICNLARVRQGKTVYIVGGGYKGKYNLDIDDLIKEGDYSLVRRLFSCMSIPKEHHDDIIQEEILGNNLIFEKDVVEYNSRSYPECGNISFYRIHEFFPSSTQDFILGSDYFFIETIIHARQNLTYHNRAVIHQHTPDRTACLEKIFNYWKGLMMLVDSQIYYRSLYEQYIDVADDASLSDLKNILSTIIHGMKEFFPLFKKDYVLERQDKKEQLIKVLSESLNPVVRKVSNLLRNEIESVEQCTNQSIVEHIELLENWRTIIKTAKKLSKTTKMQNILRATMIN